MPTEGSFKGNLVRLSIDPAGSSTYVEVAYQEELTIDINGEPIPALFKGASDWGAQLTGTKSYTFTLTAHIINGSGNDLKKFFDALVNGTQFTWEVTSGVTGDTQFSGTAEVQNLNITYPLNDVARYTITCGGIGAITDSVVV